METMETQPCSPTACHLLADALGDSPEPVIAVHLLRRGLARAYVAGALARYGGAIVQAIDNPREPMGFGTDAAVLWDLLRVTRGWFCVEVAPECAAALGASMARDLGLLVRYYEDVYYTLTTPATPVYHEAVRLLTVDDLTLLEAAPSAVRGSGFGSTRALLVEGVVAAAIVDGRVVAIAHTSARTSRHADIGVATLQEWRGHNFATAAAALVAGSVQQARQIPVWSAGAANGASRCVAQKVGFDEVSRRTYVIVDALRS